MIATGFTCSRCQLARPAIADVRFCPRCGLASLPPAAGAADAVPVNVTLARQAYRVFDRIAAGSVSNVYRCRFTAGCGRRPVEGVMKVARDARANAWIANEAAVLRRLHAGAGSGRFAPFLPRLRASFLVDDGGDPAEQPRRANVLEHDPAIPTPDELYTLAEVRAAHATGLEGRDVAWVWRRLLAVLGFAHGHGVAHGAVLPPHVLIEPREHKLVLVDWCSACCADAPPGCGGGAAVPVITGGHHEWFRRQGATRRPADAATDVAMGARCMVELLGGDPLAGECPPRVEPALARHFQRCLGAAESSAREARTYASRLLNEFDRLIEVLWGPRTFRALAMPPKPPRRP